MGNTDQEGVDTKVTTTTPSLATLQRRQKYASRALQPWYWPYESNIRNIVMYVLGGAVIYFFLSEKLLIYRARQRRHAKAGARKRKEANSSEESSESKLSCEEDLLKSQEKMQHLTEIVREANRKPRKDPSQGETGLRARVSQSTVRE